jgi:hypothetical protein
LTGRGTRRVDQPGARRPAHLLETAAEKQLSDRRDRTTRAGCDWAGARPPADLIGASHSLGSRNAAQPTAECVRRVGDADRSRTDRPFITARAASAVSGSIIDRTPVHGRPLPVARSAAPVPAMLVIVKCASAFGLPMPWGVDSRGTGGRLPSLPMTGSSGVACERPPGDAILVDRSPAFRATARAALSGRVRCSMP